MKPVPSHTLANTHTSPMVPTLKPSYSQVTRLGIRAHDPGKQHVIGARDRPHDLQVLWGSRDPRAHDPMTLRANQTLLERKSHRNF